MKFAFLMLGVKDGADAIKGLATPWMIVFGVLTALTTALTWMFSWDIIPVIVASFAIFSGATLCVGMSVVVGSLAEIVMSLTGHTEIELEEIRAFS